MFPYPSSVTTRSLLSSSPFEHQAHSPYLKLSHWGFDASSTGGPHILTASAWAVQYADNSCVCAIVFFYFVYACAALHYYLAIHFNFSISPWRADFRSAGGFTPAYAHHTGTSLAHHWHIYPPHPTHTFYPYPTAPTPTFQFLPSLSPFQFFTPFLCHFAPHRATFYLYEPLTYHFFHNMPPFFTYPFITLFIREAIILHHIDPIPTLYRHYTDPIPTLYGDIGVWSLYGI